MSLIEIYSLEVGRCRVAHPGSGASFTTDLPVEYGGRGASFSATDLIAAALGVCVATNIDGVAARHGVPPGTLRVRVEKSLAAEPKCVASLAVEVEIAAAVAPGVVALLERAARHCAVRRSLHPDVGVQVKFNILGGDTE